MTPAPNVVYSSESLEYLVDGPDAARFVDPSSQLETLLVPSLSVYEVFKRVLQQRDETAALQAAALMPQGMAVDLDVSLAIVAAKLAVDLTLPMADAIILATARRFGATLWTRHADFEGIPGVRLSARTSPESVGVAPTRA